MLVEVSSKESAESVTVVSKDCDWDWNWDCEGSGSWEEGDVVVQGQRVVVELRQQLLGGGDGLRLGGGGVYGETEEVRWGPEGGRQAVVLGVARHEGRAVEGEGAPGRAGRGGGGRRSGWGGGGPVCLRGAGEDEDPGHAGPGRDAVCFRG